MEQATGWLREKMAEQNLTGGEDFRTERRRKKNKYSIMEC